MRANHSRGKKRTLGKNIPPSAVRLGEEKGVRTGRRTTALILDEGKKFYIILGKKRIGVCWVQGVKDQTFGRRAG